jgi:hypothetical protein
VVKIVQDTDFKNGHYPYRTEAHKRHEPITIRSDRNTPNKNFRGAPTKVTAKGEKKPDVCRRGHPFTPENTINKKEGGRKCRTCFNMAARERKAAAKR